MGTTMPPFVALLLAVVLTMAAPGTYPRDNSSSSETCCVCAEDGDQHSFDSVTCDCWPGNPDPPLDCKLCDFNIHQGCHANRLFGACTYHQHCLGYEDDEDRESAEAFVAALGEDRSADALALAEAGAGVGGFRVNHARQAIQIIDCQGNIAGHFELDERTLSALGKWALDDRQ